MISYTAELTRFDLRTQCYVTQDVLLDTLLLQIYDKLSREHNVSLYTDCFGHYNVNC